MGDGGEFRHVFPAKPLIGMIHLPALPGAPRNALAVDELIQFALVELRKLENAGLDAVILENVGDTPFFKEHLPPVTVAAMANISREVVTRSRIAVGLNLLRNACAEALSVSKTLLFGDVHVKHAHPIFDVPIEDAARDLAERGGADAVIVSGSRSPVPPSREALKSVRNAVELPVLVGSGVGLANVQELYQESDGLIIGEPDFKVDGVWGGSNDERAYARAVHLCRG